MKKIIKVFITVTAILLCLNSCSLKQTVLNCADETLMLEHGRVSNNVFISDMYRLRFSPGPNWKFESDEELLSDMEITDYADIDEGWKKAADRDSVYDMKATEPVSGNSVIICLDNLARIKDGKDYTVESFAQLTKDRIIGETDYKNDFKDVYKTTFAGDEWTVLESVADVNGKNVYQSYNFLKVENFIVTVIITDFEGGAAADTIKKAFSAR